MFPNPENSYGLSVYNIILSLCIYRIFAMKNRLYPSVL